MDVAGDDSLRKRRITWRIAIIAAIVAMAIVLVVFYNLLNQPVAAPSHALNSLLDSANKHDSNGIVDSTIWKFANSTDYDALVHSLYEDPLLRNYSYHMQNVSTRFADEMTPQLRNFAEGEARAFEFYFGIDITEYSWISFNISRVTVATGHLTNIQGNSPCFCVSDHWYLGDYAEVLRVDLPS